MKVIKYIAENADLIMDDLERVLCKQGISYVRIDNEFHFQDKIIRILDFEKDHQDIIASSMCFDCTKSINPKSTQWINQMPNKGIIKQKEYQKRTRKIQKQESNRVKQKLKRFSK